MSSVIIFKRPPVARSVSEHAMQKAIVALIENHRDEFNERLADETARLDNIECRHINIA